MTPNEPLPPDTADSGAKAGDAASVTEVLRRWEAEVDPVQRARLAAARHRALAKAPSQPRLTGAARWLAPALVAGLVLVIALPLGRRTPSPGSTGAPAAAAEIPILALAEAPDWLAGDELASGDADLAPDPDLDLYLWLSGADEAG